MNQILFLSGKGGTGKTTVAGAFAMLASEKILADCDVDAANLHLLFEMTPINGGTFEGSNAATIDTGRCTRCGRCAEICRFHAIGESIVVDPFLCEGCGACETICPENAITLTPRISGRWVVAETPVAPLVTAELIPGEEASGKLVTHVKRRATDLAKDRGLERIIIDGSPGIGCPVIASTAGVDLAILVTEPSLSGLHDLKRILEVVRHFGIDAQLVVNKHDLSPELSGKIEAYAKEEHVSILGRIPYDPAVSMAMVRGSSPVNDPTSAAGKALREIYDRYVSNAAAAVSES